MNKKPEILQKNICIELLDSFSEKEMGKLRQLVTCSYFNTDTCVIRLLDILYKDVWRKRQFDAEMQYHVYGKLFSENQLKSDQLNELQKKQLSTKMSVLTRLAEQFLKVEALDKNSTYSSDLLLQEVLQKRQFRLFKRLINKSKKELLSQSQKDLAYHQQLQSIEKNKLNYLHRSGELLKNDNLNELIYQTDIQYFLEKLSLCITSLSLQNVTSHKYNTSIDLMFPMLDLPQYATHPLIQIYCATIKLMRDASEENYRLLLTSLDQNEAAVLKSDLNGFYVVATNFCAQQILKGSFGYQELFELYHTMDEKNLLVEGDFIPVGKLKNTITAGCRVGQFEWAISRTEKYRNTVKKNLRDSVFHFNMGAIAFYQQDYRHTLHHLVRVESINLAYDSDCRVMMMKAHYETDWEYDERTLQIFRSTEKYFNENKAFTPRNKKGYKNFIRALINLYRIRHQATKMTLQSIKVKLEKQEVNVDKRWLMGKIEELEK